MKTYFNTGDYIVHARISENGRNGIAESYIHKSDILSFKKPSLWQKVCRVTSFFSCGRILIALFSYLFLDLCWVNYENLRKFNCENRIWFLKFFYRQCEYDRVSHMKVSNYLFSIIFILLLNIQITKS